MAISFPHRQFTIVRRQAQCYQHDVRLGVTPYSLALVPVKAVTISTIITVVIDGSIRVHVYVSVHEPKVYDSLFVCLSVTLQFRFLAVSSFQLDNYVYVTGQEAT